MMGKVVDICISEKKGTKKQPVKYEEVIIDKLGIVGDSHRGEWHRQISLLSKESIDKMVELIPDLSAGAFAENIITEKISLKELKIGDKLQFSENVILEVTQIGKKCHNSCEIKKITGDCIMPKEGIFTKVIQPGKIEKGCLIKKIG